MAIYLHGYYLTKIKFFFPHFRLIKPTLLSEMVGLGKFYELGLLLI